MTDSIEPIWCTSSRSNNGGECVEVAMNLVTSTGRILLRDSKNPDGPILSFTPAEWEAFTAGVRDGELSL